MSLKNISLISFIIISLVFLLNLYYSILYLNSEWIFISKILLFIEAIVWLPFMLFFWKIYKGK